MKTKTKLAIGIFILVLIFYFGIVFYLFYLNERNKIFENNCYFNFTNCSYDYVYRFNDNINRKYNNSINNLRGFILNGT